MKILEILPELELGGVERHVIDLANVLVVRGHDVTVISNGGQMESQLSSQVKTVHYPVHRKSFINGYLCARQISKLIRSEKYDVIHAHSRVPAWISMWVSNMTDVPYVVTCHCEFGNKTPIIYIPYRNAACTICVSQSVQEHMKECFYNNTKVIVNGLDTPQVIWHKPDSDKVKFLFVGRLSEVKGLQDVLKAMPSEDTWTMDVLGDGPYMDELKTLTMELGFEKRVTFHGYSDKVDDFMAKSSCLLFPSHLEGFGLTLARSAQIGLPVLASDIKAVREMAKSDKGLVAPGNVDEWRKAIVNFIATGNSPTKIPLSSIPTLENMVDEDEKVYRQVIADKKK